MVIYEIRNSVHDYLRPLRQNVGQKVGQTSLRYYQVYVLHVGSVFGISGAQSKVDEVSALCMIRDAESPWLSGIIVSGFLPTEICR